MRMFIALPVPPDIRRALLSAQDELRALTSGGSYVPYENFHVTLHFIGESDELYGAASALDQAVRGIRPILLRLSKPGRFKKGEAFTAYMGLEGDMDELHNLHESLLSALMDRGFPHGGQKRLTPHITLARKLTPLSPDGFDALEADNVSAFRANQLFLYQSQNVNGRMVYTPLHRAKLI